MSRTVLRPLATDAEHKPKTLILSTAWTLHAFSDVHSFPLIVIHELPLRTTVGQVQVRERIEVAGSGEAMERAAPVLCDLVLSLLETPCTANILR